MNRSRLCFLFATGLQVAFLIGNLGTWWATLNLAMILMLIAMWLWTENRYQRTVWKLFQDSVGNKWPIPPAPVGVRLQRKDGTVLNCELTYLGQDSGGMAIWIVAGIVAREGDSLYAEMMPPHSCVMIEGSPGIMR